MELPLNKISTRHWKAPKSRRNYNKLLIGDSNARLYKGGKGCSTTVYPGARLSHATRIINQWTHIKNVTSYTIACGYTNLLNNTTNDETTRRRDRWLHCSGTGATRTYQKSQNRGGWNFDENGFLTRNAFTSGIHQRTNTFSPPICMASPDRPGRGPYGIVRHQQWTGKTN